MSALSSLKEKSKASADKVAERIREECESEARIFAGLKKAKDGIGCLRASTAIAHNLGDLDRVIAHLGEKWGIAEVLIDVAILPDVQPALIKGGYKATKI